MSVLILLIFASLAVATTFLIGFIWAVRSGQYEDTCTPSMRMLTEEIGRPVSPPTGSGEHQPDLGLHSPALSRIKQDNLRPVTGKTCGVSQPGIDLNSRT